MAGMKGELRVTPTTAGRYQLFKFKEEAPYLRTAGRKKGESRITPIMGIELKCITADAEATLIPLLNEYTTIRLYVDTRKASHQLVCEGGLTIPDGGTPWLHYRFKLINVATSEIEVFDEVYEAVGDTEANEKFELVFGTVQSFLKTLERHNARQKPQ